MAVSPITPQTYDWRGKTVTIFIDFTSTGATKAETVTITDAYPILDLNMAHPIISMKYFSTEGSTVIHQSETAYNLENEMARGTAPDSAGEFDIEGAASLKIYTTYDHNGTLCISYFAAGNQNQ